MARGYRVTLDASLRVPWLMLLVTLGTIVATVWAFGVVKKGFLPTEDTSIIIVRTEAAPDIAFQAMLERQRIVAERIRAGSRRALRQLQRAADASSIPRSTAARSSCSSRRAASG